MIEELTKVVQTDRDLSESEAQRALELVLSEETPDAAIAALLTALADKGESSEEIIGFARIMRQQVIPIQSRQEKLIDTAGTGGGADTFNISTTAAFIIAGAGVPVAKHGNRALTSRCGSADLLAALGVSIECPPEVARVALESIGLAFMFAPLFHPAMKRVAQIRRELKHRTIFNMLGPLTNPASAHYQIIGVYSPDLTEKLAEAAGSVDACLQAVEQALACEAAAFAADPRIRNADGTSLNTCFCIMAFNRFFNPTCFLKACHHLNCTITIFFFCL